MRFRRAFWIVLILAPAPALWAEHAAPPDGTVLKRTQRLDQGGKNLLKADAWTGWQRGFARGGGPFFCDNGDDAQVQRGVSQTVTLNQQKPTPIIATAWSKAQAVGGTRDSDYALYLDLRYTDGTPLWGQVNSFNTGTHDWEKAQVIVFPAKPVARVSFHMLLRRHTGKAWFRDPTLTVVDAFLFDGVPVQEARPSPEGFQVRNVAAESDFVSIRRNALDLSLDCRTQQVNGATLFDVTLRDTSGRDRAITLVYATPLPPGPWQWLQDPRSAVSAEQGQEYVHAGRFGAGANGRLSRYPFAAVAGPDRGVALGIDMARPAFFRVGYNAGTRELFLAYDIGLAPEKPTAHVRFCKFDFDPMWRFRGALARFYELFPEQFRCRIGRQGLWMPFARISDVNDWRDFGFRFKEGTNETGWDDEHDILTFRYTEPMTWWMSMPKEMPRTLSAALAEARRLAEDGNSRARALLTSGYHDETGRFAARLRDTPWCNGAVWSVNSMPGIAADITDFKNKWNPDLCERLYGSAREAELDGEYIDSSEGYVTDELDFRRDHFRAAETPLTFSLEGRKVAVFRGLIVFEYIRAIERDIRAMGKYMMANSTPYRLCWLIPMLDVVGTETNWNPGRTWRPMSDSDLLYRRALCKGKPYCFLMNTVFEDFSHEHVEKYMRRCLAYGMFPGFFSHNASQGHYFTRPELYERDRDLFRKYIPLCKRVAEAGWEPITGARSDSARVYVERFGTEYLTVFNDSAQQTEVTVIFEADVGSSARELLTGRVVEWRDRTATLTLGPEDVAVLELD
jgi:hypothetical protein